MVGCGRVNQLGIYSNLCAAPSNAAFEDVSNAMTAAESAYVDTRDFAAVTADMLTDIDPSISFAIEDGAGQASARDAQQNQVGYDNTLGANAYGVGTQSQSGTDFGVEVNKTADAIGSLQPGNTFYINGTAATW